MVIPVYRLIFPSKGPQTYVSVPKGGEDTYRNVAKDKIALVESGGDVTDEDRVNALRQAGAKGSSFIKMGEQGDTLANSFHGVLGTFCPVMYSGLYRKGASLSCWRVQA